MIANWAPKTPFFRKRFVIVLDNCTYKNVKPRKSRSWGFTSTLTSWIELNCFCGMVDRRKAFSLVSSQDHCQRSSQSRISDMPRAGFEPAQNLSSGFVEWSCAVAITTTPRHHTSRRYVDEVCLLQNNLLFLSAVYSIHLQSKSSQNNH